MDFFNRQKQIINEFDQEKLKKTSILVAGIGGLGSPLCQQLVRLGVGTVHLVDNGILDPPDLNRQILYTKNDLGKFKVEIASKNLIDIGLSTNVYPHNITILKGFDFKEKIDFVIDCLDNFEARYYLDDFIQKRKVPMIHGGIHGMYGQVTVIIPGKTLSLREIFGETIPELKDKIPVMAPIPSLIASIQVIEFVKVFCNLSDTLKNRLLKVNLNDYSIDIIDLI